jgi:hypothetical protein
MMKNPHVFAGIGTAGPSFQGFAGPGKKTLAISANLCENEKGKFIDGVSHVDTKGEYRPFACLPAGQID